MQKALSNGRLPGAESQAIQVITNDHARALAPGKMRGAHSLAQSLTTFLTRADCPVPLFRLSSTIFQTSNQKLTGDLPDIKFVPLTKCVRIFKKKRF